MRYDCYIIIFIFVLLSFILKKKKKVKIYSELETRIWTVACTVKKERSMHAQSPEEGGRSSGGAREIEGV